MIRTISTCGFDNLTIHIKYTGFDSTYIYDKSTVWRRTIDADTIRVWFSGMNFAGCGYQADIFVDNEIKYTESAQSLSHIIFKVY